MANNKDFGEPFVVTQRIRDLAKEQGWPDPDKEVAAFIDHHEATGWIRKGGIKITNREAAFRTWLRKASEWRPAKVEQPRPRQTINPQEIRDPRVRELWADLLSKVSK